MGLLEGVELFVRRGQTVGPRFEITPDNRAQICALVEKLDGLPLAIELAAARLNLFTLEELSDDTTWAFWTGVRSVDALDVGAGTLVIDLLDAVDREIVWRGLASEALHPVPDKNLKKIDRAVRKMFRQLPPTGPAR